MIPVLVSGTYAKPVFATEPSRIAKRTLEGLPPAKDNPKRALGGLLDSLRGKKTQKQPEQRQN